MNFSFDIDYVDFCLLAWSFTEIWFAAKLGAWQLDYVPHGNAFVVSNAPAELRERFQAIGHHDENAVAKLLRTIYRL